MHQEMMKLAREIAAELAEDPRIETILLTGSVAKGHVDRFSDLDMMIGYSELPSPEAIEAMGEAAVATGGGIYSKDPEHGIALYRWVDGIKVDQGHGRVADVESRMEAFLADPAVDDDTNHVIMSGITGGVALKGADRIARWQARAADFPEGYDEALVRAGLRFPPRAILEGMGLERGDLALVWELLLASAKRAVQVLSGLNRRYPPGKLKGLRYSLADLPIAPAGTPDRLCRALASPADEAVRALMAYHAELWDLIDENMPQISTDEARAFIDTPLRKVA